MKVRKAVIPAAGIGSRFLPFTKAQPKEMLPIVDKPAIQCVMEEAVQSGIDNVLIVTGKQKRSIEDHFDRSVELEVALRGRNQQLLIQELREISEMANIHYLRQAEPLGLGHAVLCAEHFVGDEPFAILLPDEVFHHDKPCLAQLMDLFDQHQTSIVGVQEVPREELHKYGVISGHAVSSESYRLNTIVEKPNGLSPSNLAIIGRYILEPKIFEHLKHTGPGAGGEVQLSDAISSLCTQHEVLACKVEGRRYDIGNKLSFLKATIDFALERDGLGDQLADYLSTLVKNLPSKKGGLGT